MEKELELDLVAFTKSIAEVALPEHANYPESCTCFVCSGWREAKSIFLEAHGVVARHKRTCMCDDCKIMRRLRSRYRAADNRRDVYCEMSFQAAFLQEKDLIMAFVTAEVTPGKRTDGWWEGRAPYYPVAWWLLQARNKLQMTPTITVTGVVTSTTTTIIVSGSPPSQRLLDYIVNEEREILAELTNIPAYRRLQTVRDILTILRREDQALETKVKRGRKGSKAKLIITTAIEHFLQTQQRATAKQLSDIMHEKGIVICENGAEVQRISSYLSASPLFNYQKHEGGYGLKEWSTVKLNGIDVHAAQSMQDQTTSL